MKVGDDWVYMVKMAGVGGEGQEVRPFTEVRVPTGEAVTRGHRGNEP